MTRTFIAAMVAVGFTVVGGNITPANAKMPSESDAVRVPVDFVGERHHQRTIFDEIRDTAPRSIFDQLAQTAPHTPFDLLRDSAP